MIDQNEELEVNQETFQDLLAADPLQRFRADDLIFHWIAEQEEDKTFDLFEVLTVAALRPSPEVFVRALVAYWSDLSSELFYQRMAAFGQEPEPPSDPPGWRHDDLNQYTLEPHETKIVNVLRGAGAWEVVRRLGIHGAAVESQLLACLEHPEPSVCDAAEIALGGIESLDDVSFDQFLRHADRMGRNHMVKDRARALARHVTSAARYDALTIGLQPGVEEDVLEARCAVFCALKQEPAAKAQALVGALIPLAWDDEQRALLVHTLTRISSRCGFRSCDQELVRGVMESGAKTRTNALGFLAASEPAANESELLRAVAGADPAELSSICDWLGCASDIPASLLRSAVAAALGNYDLYDGLPHDEAVALILEHPDYAAGVQEEIIDWWLAAAGDELEHGEIADAVKLCEALGDKRGVRMLPGFRRALRWFEEEDGDEMPELGEPGAVEAIAEIYGVRFKCQVLSGRERLVGQGVDLSFELI